ncbi:hypothetical protein [Roseisalinus antarcticus]|uniref:Right handed beta helix domain-containing protein n=1 Tax=Roseisalinus antarcticus TaxID=254357 RepID=A0A1Y5RXK1_9RHOB|nr:hypothetical protein [Roseisalinus antarcticus]SLN27301.1 hypothetical protein ROA7023_00874 [Roseisalinus antarcticus]
MTITTFLRSATALALTTGAAFAEAPVLVTSTADSGAGSFRAALETLADTGGQIVVTAEGDITIDSTLDYAGTAPLYVFGAGQTVRTAANATLFAATAGADLTINGLNFAGPGGFDIENRGDIDGPAGKGIFVDVRDDQQGYVSLVLENVTVSGVANHGVHVSDCDLADACGGGAGGSGGGSEASIIVRLAGVTIDNVGHGKFDADGLRVDERAAGSINFSATASTFRNVGADGVELDDGQAGDVRVIVTGSAFVGNGAYCDPQILAAFMPDAPEGEFDEGTMPEADIPGPVTGAPDDSCIEREVDTYDDGTVEEYAFGIDLDDGFDVDEAGDGSVVATLADTTISRNLDEGLDLDEEGPGGIDLVLIDTAASGNTDDGFKTSEEDAGDVSGLMLGTSAADNGGVGAVFEEADGGDVTVIVQGSMTMGNDDGGTGLEVVQEDGGSGRLVVTSSDIQEEIEVDGVDRSDM